MTPQEAERAAEHLLRSWGCTHTVRSMRTRFARQDLFACDVIGLLRGDLNSLLYAAQVTTGHSGDVARRRRKLEAVPWPNEALVYLLEVRRKPCRFRIHTFFRWMSKPARLWEVLPHEVPIPPEWRKAWKEAKA